MREIVIDTETTGLDYKAGDRIIEVGCVELKNYVPTGNTLQFYCKPDRSISEGAKNIVGLSDVFLNQQKPFEQNHKELLNFLKNDTLIIHNASFDLAHLNHELEIIGKDKINNQITDTLVLARDKFPGSSTSLDALCKRYRIDNSNRVQHTALIDCGLLAKVYINLIDQKEPTLNFQKKEEPSETYKKSKIVYFKKVVEPTSEELKKHKEFLKTDLKKNFFN